jgi:hypothetical protein
MNSRRIAENAALDILARFDLEPEPGESPLAAYAEQLGQVFTFVEGLEELVETAVELYAAATRGSSA